MSAHAKLRKAFHVADGSYAEVVVNIHNVDPTPADLILSKIMLAAEHAVADYKELINNRVREEAESTAARVAALRRQVDPENKVISHGSAELHEEMAKAVEPAKPSAKRKAVQHG